MDFRDKYKKEDLEKYIFEDELSYREIGRIYSVSDTYIKKVAGKLGISLRKRKNFPKDFSPHNRGTGKTIECKNCGKLVENLSWNKQKFCNHKCSSDYDKEKRYNDYLENQELYCDKPHGMRFLKQHLLNEQNNKCLICDIKDEWNNKPMVFILDHIDGDASNNMKKNLRLICPNCDSQLDTYKSKNKNSARKEKYLKQYKN